MSLVFSKLDWKQIGVMLKTANPFYFAGAVLMFLASQLVSIFRFNLFIRKVGVRISFEANSKLYLLGMFYNFFIPGGVGGDAYKAYILSKTHSKSLKKLGQVVFLDRFLGIVAIGFVTSILGMFITLPFPYFWNILVLVLGIIGTTIILKLAIRYFHTHKKRVYIGFYYSVLVQVCQIVCVLFILKSFQVEGSYSIYLLLFLVSSVLSVISFAGLGIREAVFYYGATWFQFNSDTSASVALAFSIITAVVSFMGIIYLFKSIPLKK